METVNAVENLSTDEQLALLWVIYQALGSSITSVPPGPARLFLTGGLLLQIKQMSQFEQLQVMRELVIGVDNPITRQYGMFSEKTKLVFWSQLFEWMGTGEVIALPNGYKLSPASEKIFKQIASLDFSEQIAVLRKMVINMGIDPLAN
ncbi:MAG: Orange carotenoid protein [Symploca sp. SIO3C6]|nr:Orange carotenoid protein [Symploca sp. SIO3C6]NET03998.1 Orange carotenoid protein [Symploca sp. SIO2B6]